MTTTMVMAITVVFEHCNTAHINFFTLYHIPIRLYSQKKFSQFTHRETESESKVEPLHFKVIEQAVADQGSEPTVLCF